MIISVVSQKGGVGKSSLARTLAVEFTRAGWRVLLADTDYGQATSNRWNENRRQQAELKPEVNGQTFPSTHQALLEATNYDLVVIDGAPHATHGTQEAAAHSDLVIIPTGSSLDDLEPGILLGNELAKYENSKIAFVLIRTTSTKQEREARETLEGYGFDVLPGEIPMKTGYITALDSGRALTETEYPTLNKHAMDIVNHIDLKVNHE